MPLQVANHRHAPEPPVQQGHTAADAEGGQPAEQPLEHLGHLLAALDHGQRQGEALTPVVDVGGGIGVEVAGAALGLGAVDLQLGVERQAVVGDQHQVDGYLLGAAEQPSGHVHRQGAVGPLEQVALGLNPLRVAFRMVSRLGAATSDRQAAEREQSREQAVNKTCSSVIAVQVGL